MSPLKRQVLIITVICAAIMELIDTSIVNVALSYMSGNLGSTLEDTAWVITSYAIANVIIIPMTSFLSTKLGRRNYYIGSIILFTICSFMCGNASGISELVLFRFLQGLGGGALLSVSAAVVYEQFPKEKIGTASALFGIGVFIGPTIGPTLGGYITENFSWPWIFYINIPIGIAAATSCYFLLAEPTVKAKAGGIDWTGIILLTIGIGSLQTVLERGQAEDWFAKGYILALTIIAVISLTAFVLWELHTPNPVVDLRVLKSKSLSVAAILTFITGVGMFTSIFLTPVIAQRLLGFTPTETGLLLLPGAIIAVFALIFTGKILQSGVSPVIVILVGFISFIFFNWSMSQISLDTSASYITTRLIFRAVGMALLTVPLSSLAVSSLPAKDMPQGTALNNMMRQLGGSFGISAITTYSTRRTASHRVDLISNITAGNPQVTERVNRFTSYFQHKGIGLLDAHQKAIKMVDVTVVKQSTLLSYIDSYMLIGLLFALALPLLLLVMKRKAGPPKLVLNDH
ncbi:DHA2 family efflux MFS transporter permease subunit [Mucilaginibacter corticis]|uniref:DHA2 family efflux MFS transporter permease subunit n=1 Tax=Mucilaginibacter corticis TaxID=2597670 RepID=A0A556MVZ6_9SPHI|nr:DHA2 family efflux MFS transporter permease subunit [Mucilaginibacter corticis]TSJ44035.1 DHA2 family efflux MFS transporter permease subunit [Mucilaginibacter corticis]